MEKKIETKTLREREGNTTTAIGGRRSTPNGHGGGREVAQGWG